MAQSLDVACISKLNCCRELACGEASSRYEENFAKELSRDAADGRQLVSAVLKVYYLAFQSRNPVVELPLARIHGCHHIDVTRGKGGDG